MKSFRKRGQEDKLYFLIWEGIALALVFIVILVALRGIVTNSSYWKRYYSTDIGFMGDLANVNQGDFTINYNLQEQGENFWTKVYLIPNKMFEFVILKDSIEAYDNPKEQIQSPRTYPYAKHKDVTVEEGDIVSNFLVISKKGSIFSVNDYEPTGAVLNAIPCLH